MPINAVTTREKKDVFKNELKKEGTEEPTLSFDDLDIVVFVMGKDKKIRKTPVKTGIQDINYIEITAGLNEGDEVITGPYETVNKDLKDSTDVKIVDNDYIIITREEYDKLISNQNELKNQ